MSMASGARSVRFTPADFRYHGRVALALVPSLLVAASLGGRPVMGIITVGAMVWYLMDAMQLREAALSVVSSSRRAQGVGERLGWSVHHLAHGLCYIASHAQQEHQQGQ
jgi:hypothetical protein